MPAENASGVVNRYTPFTEYLSHTLGTKVTLRVANDYAAVIEGQRAGNIHIGYYGPASFSRARMTGVQTDAFVIDVNSDGTKGYYSVFYVRADSPYQKIEDLKGKNIGLVDPNSTSGYNMPLYTLDKLGIEDARRYFSKVLVTGSHENAVIAVADKTVDVCANWWNADDDSNLTRMLTKGMLKNANGSPMKKDDFRIILKSALIINSPTAMLSDLPPDLKTAIRAAYHERRHRRQGGVRSACPTARTCRGSRPTTPPTTTRSRWWPSSTSCVASRASRRRPSACRISSRRCLNRNVPRSPPPMIRRWRRGSVRLLLCVVVFLLALGVAVVGAEVESGHLLDQVRPFHHPTSTGC